MSRKQTDEPGDPPFLSVAWEAGRRCGVTRLGEITGLDRIGLPVWQAVRPASRAISVHQGKALTGPGARIGALCEAIESHWAEQVEADGPLCPAPDLAGAERIACLDDLLVDRARPHDWSAPLAWCTAADLASGKLVHLPHAFVSLDFRGGFPSRIERSSNGLGAGPDEAAALTTALFEVIERDAVAAWSQKRIVARMAARIDPRTVPFDWFQAWRERLCTQGAGLDLYSLPSLAAMPAIRCAIQAEAAFGSGRRVTVGTAAHASAETALAKAFAEAAQTRLTWIAGARDDFYPCHYVPRAEIGELDDEEDEMPGRAWPEPTALPGEPVAVAVERLAEAGYRQVLVKRLDRGGDGVVVVKVFVPGLGLLGRTRRAWA